MLGTAAMLAGYTRMTYSLAIIMMETAQAMNMFLPIVMVIMVANFVGSLFTRGLYDRAIRGKQMPILVDTVPFPCKVVTVTKMMAEDLHVLQRVESLEVINKAMNYTHHAFPVVNSSGNLIGMIPKNFLITIIANKGYYINPEGPEEVLSINENGNKEEEEIEKI